MQKLLKCFRQERYLPFDSYTWTRLLGEAKKNFLIKSGCLYSDDTTVNELRIDGDDFNVQKIGNAWYAFGEDKEIKLSFKDIVKLELNKKAFAKKISELLEIQNPLSKLQHNCDGFYLGNLNLGASYRVFFCFNHYKFVEAMRDLLGDCRPLVILFDTASGEIQDFVSRKGGECLPFEACITLTEKGFSVFGSLKDLLGTPRKIKSESGYYAWASTGFPMPNNPSVSLLKIDLVSPSEISVAYGGNTMKFHYSEVSIFRNDNTHEFNENWHILIAVALKKPYRNVVGESLKTYLKRLNTAMRDFFGFKGTAFSLHEEIITPNFDLYASYKHDKRSRSQTFEGNSTLADSERY